MTKTTAGNVSWIAAGVTLLLAAIMSGCGGDRGPASPTDFGPRITVANASPEETAVVLHAWETAKTCSRWTRDPDAYRVVLEDTQGDRNGNGIPEDGYTTATVMYLYRPEYRRVVVHEWLHVVLYLRGDRDWTQHTQPLWDLCDPGGAR